VTVRTRRRRDLWLTSVLGLTLLAAIPVLAITGLLSNAAYDPRLGSNVLAQGRSLGPFDFYLFPWPTDPAWLYAFTQGLHVTLGLGTLPVVLAKLWSVLPELRLRGPSARVARMLERITLIVLVGGVLFEFFTGIFEIEYFFPWHAQLIPAHYYGAWVLIVAFVLHAASKLPATRRALATRRTLDGLAIAPAPVSGTAATVPRTQAVTRRLVLGTAAAGSLILLAEGAAQTIGGPLRQLGLLAPRGNATGPGPNDFEVNGTAASAGLTAAVLGASWRMELRGASSGASRRLSRAQLQALPQYTHSLPIACREGWSTTQRWTGVRLRDLAALIGEHGAPVVAMQSLDGAVATLAANQVADERSLLALDVNGVPLSFDHGYPARVIVPGTIAVNCLKWIESLEFGVPA
jgi:DMSO/TMAO reductase YedYZ molybdopterin-dependent catalytic subunit